MLKFCVQKRILRGEMPAGKTILIVENDAPISTFLIQTISRRTPHAILSAKDMHWASEIIKAIPLDLLLLEAQLPEIQSIKLYDQFQGTKELEAIPTLTFTTNGEFYQKSNERGQQVGMLLPLEQTTLFQIIEKVLSDPQKELHI